MKEFMPPGRAGMKGARYGAAMEQLIGVVQRLSLARNVAAVTEIVRRAARSLTGADGATFVLRDGDRCFYAEEDAIAPLWKGQRFPMDACISGWVMRNGEPAVIRDIYADPRIPADAYRPTFVKSLAMVPVRREAPIAAIGNYWSSPRQPSPEEVAILQALADTTSVALENAELYQKQEDQLRLLAGQQTRIREQCDTLEIFTRAMAHDLKEPLRSIRSFTAIVGEETELPEETARHFGYIRAGADRMALLIDSIYRYTAVDSAETATATPCDMAAALGEVEKRLHPLIKERDARLLIRQPRHVNANRGHMEQLWECLVGNAIVHNSRPAEIIAGSLSREGRTVFFVQDNGQGIAADEAKRIFHPFRRMTHAPGRCGLGLALCRKIAALYGGEIWHEAVEGGGARFCFTLPDAEIAMPEARSADGGLAHILIVDDREDDVEFAQRSLVRRPKLQCRVSCARDGEEAHAFLNQDNMPPVDLVLLDINMPVMNGFELLERMGREGSLTQASVIMCSGSEYGPDRRRAEELGAAGYLVKPVSFERFEEIIGGLPGLSLVRGEEELLLLKTAASQTVTAFAG